MAVLAIKNLSKNFGNTQALDGVSFTVNKGQIFGFLGPNGAGKSTTIKIIMDFMHPTRGEVLVFGKNAHTNAVALKEKIGYVPAEPVLYPGWTVDEHISFVAHLSGKHMIDEAKALKHLLQLDSSKKVKELSTGNQQKLAIILALAPKPPLLILDEPTRGLDPLLRATFHELLRSYKHAGGTVLLSSHDLSEVEGLCDGVVVIHKGRIVQDTTIQALRSSRQHKVRLQFNKSVPNLSALTDIHNLNISGTVVTFDSKGDVNALIALLSKHRLTDIEITSASLEDIFREIYQ